MVETKILPQAPVLVGERVLDDRATRFGKQIVERDFRMPNGEVLPILCVINRGMDPVIVFALTEHETVFWYTSFVLESTDGYLSYPEEVRNQDKPAKRLRGLNFSKKLVLRRELYRSSAN